jgi:hypothetical protein
MAEIDQRNLRDSQLAAHYKDSLDGKMYVRTSAKSELTGLRKSLKVRCYEITDVPQFIPAIPLDDRNYLAIQNKSTSEIVYMGNDDVTADSVVGSETSGWEIDIGEKLNLDIKDSIGVWLVCESGKTAIVKTMELA